MLGKNILEIRAEALFSKDEIDAILKEIFKGSKNIPKKLFDATYNKLASAVTTGYGDAKSVEDAVMQYELTNNVAVFSAFKANHYSETMRNLLVDEQGNKRTWGDFRKEALKVDEKYNQLWLNAEYNLAVRQSRSAANWQQFEAAKDTYPNLEYMPSRSADPRDAHTRFYGVVRPIDDSFWNTAMPPNGWGCKCWVKQTRDEATGGEIEAPPSVPGIEGNAGKTGHIFSKSHPYITAVSAASLNKFVKELKELKDGNEQFVSYKIGKNAIQISVNADKTDLRDNLFYLAPFVAKYKEDYGIRAHGVNEGKQPELFKGKSIGDLTTWKKAQDVTNYVTTNWKTKYQRQLKNIKSVFVALDFNDKVTNQNVEEMWNVLYGKMKNSSRLNFVLLKNGKNLHRVFKATLDKDDDFKKLKKELL